MSALTLCAQLINYELLTTTMLNGGGGERGQNSTILSSFPTVT